MERYGREKKGKLRVGRLAHVEIDGRRETVRLLVFDRSKDKWMTCLSKHKFNQSVLSEKGLLLWFYFNQLTAIAKTRASTGLMKGSKKWKPKKPIKFE